MKKLIIYLLLFPMLIIGQTRDELINEIKTWNQKTAFQMYKDLIQNVQDKALNVSEAMFPNPYDFEKRYDKQKELEKQYIQNYIEKHNEKSMNIEMMRALDAEAVAIGDAIDGIADNVKFNGTQLIGSVAGGGAISIGINDAGNTATIGTATTIAIVNTDNITGANGVDGSADTALGQIAKSLGNVAAGMSALKGYQAVANSSAANLKAAAARIQDTDYALETANLTKAAILNQSAMAMVAQATQAQQAILTVIQ